MSNHESLQSTTNESQGLEKNPSLLRRFANRVFNISNTYLLSTHYRSEALKEVCEDWDDCGVEMPYELGKKLEKLTKDPKTWFGIHRSSMINGKSFENDLVLQKIMQEGLINAGDDSSGLNYRNPPITKTASECRDMIHTVITIKSSYKGSPGSVLVAIPMKYMDKEGKVKQQYIDEVYDNSGPSSRIRPEYLVGFVQNLGVGHTLQFKSRQEIIEASEKREQANKVG